MNEESFGVNCAQQTTFTTKNNATSLWIGDIETYMDEKFIREAFAMAGEKVVNVKIIKSKIDGSPVGYGFVSFADCETTKRVLCQLNRKQVPNAPQGKRFKLNTVGRNDSLKTYTIFVGDLPEEIDDITLFTGFSVRYPSTKTAKVILNNEGRSKCFGFVKFGDECEYETALHECPQTVTFGPKPIRVSVAIPKNKYTQRQMQTIGTSNIVLTQSSDATYDYCGNRCDTSEPQQEQHQQYDNNSYATPYNVYDAEYNPYYQCNNMSGDYYTISDNSASFVAPNAVLNDCEFMKPNYLDNYSSTNASISSFEVFVFSKILLFICLFYIREQGFLTSIHDSKWF